MGGWIDFTNRVHIDMNTVSEGVLHSLSYKDLTSELIAEIIGNEKIKYLQINRTLPVEAFIKMDHILEKRPDITFRIFGLYNETYFDLGVLNEMPNLQRLHIEAHLAEMPGLIDCEKFCELNHLKSIFLNIFDLKDYSFINGLTKDLVEFGVFADTMKGSINFDCKWLLQFSKIKTLWLGKKANRNIMEIADIPEIKELTLRGINLKDFSFLKDKKLESLGLLWCGMNKLNSLSEFVDLKHLELWRIMKLDDISFVSKLVNLETLKLQDLSHIQELPDMLKLKKLREIILHNMPIDETKIPEELKAIIKRW